ncbi:MAG: hypothetical protein ACHQNE_04275 [Candidatus Kapaibacterium sp.]
MRRAIYIIVVLCIISPEVAMSQPFWSIGPKLGYTLGDNGGFTWGFEASYFPNPIFDLSSHPLWGFTADLTFWKKYTSFHLGIEGSEMFGVDVGPTLFYSNKNLQAGVSVIPFAALLVVAYYELAWPFFQTPFQTWGGYLKIPIGLNPLPEGSAF